MRTQSLALAVILSLTSISLADSAVTGRSLDALARRAVSADVVESASAITELRSLGQAGVDALLEAYSDDVRLRREGVSTGASDARWQAISCAIDRVAGQRDAYASGLYWYTDLAQAKAAARAASKPILSLRLLGKLDEELSCANSRFFRITLYSNTAVSKLLRDHFILHWESVRPVPKITIDFGDGRKLERTLTGNSIHYVLDAEGRAIDALPGIYGPQAFGRQLERSARLAQMLSGATTDEARQTLLTQHHQARLEELDRSWVVDLSKAGVTSPPRRDLAAVGAQDNPPTAAEASRRAVTKMVRIERPIIRGTSSKRGELEARSEDAEWSKIGALYAQEAHLDAATLALMRNKNPKMFDNPDSVAFQRTVANLERSIAEDTARNRYTFETTLHQWFVAGTLTEDLRVLNDRVYSSLFLTPSNDPWLGLFPADSYTGIENEGVQK